jgi:thiamine pyrophosphokinase
MPFDQRILGSFSANVAASQTDAVLVASSAGKAILVVLFRLHAGAVATNVTFNSKGSGSGTAITELFALGANGGRADGESYNIGHFRTNVGEALTCTTGAGSTTGIGGRYYYVEA